MLPVDNVERAALADPAQRDDAGDRLVALDLGRQYLDLAVDALGPLARRDLPLVHLIDADDQCLHRAARRARRFLGVFDLDYIGHRFSLFYVSSLKVTRCMAHQAAW